MRNHALMLMNAALDPIDVSSYVKTMRDHTIAIVMMGIHWHQMMYLAIGLVLLYQKFLIVPFHLLKKEMVK
jgi:hypothetical protein